MTFTPDPRAAGISTNEYTESLPRRRYSHEARGQVLLLPSSGLVVVPFNQNDGSWTVAVVDGHGSYPVGGHHISVGDGEIETAITVTLGQTVTDQIIHHRDETETLADGSYILTRDGHSLRKGSDETGTLWTRFLHDPLRTDELSDGLFPATVRNPTPAP